MDDRLPLAWALRWCLPLLLPLLLACRSAPAFTPRPLAIAPPAGPCCEREPIHDLFAAPYRRGER